MNGYPIPVIAFAIAYIFVGVVFPIDDMSKTGAWVLIILFTVAFSAVLYWIRGNQNSCPKCHAYNSMREISRDFFHATATTTRAARNKRIVDVPATRRFYRCIDECQKCGYRQVVQREEVTKDRNGI